MCVVNWCFTSQRSPVIVFFDPLPHLISTIPTLATFSSASKCISSVELHMRLWCQKLQGSEEKGFSGGVTRFVVTWPSQSLNLYQQCVRLHKIDFVAFTCFFFSFFAPSVFVSALLEMLLLLSFSCSHIFHPLHQSLAFVFVKTHLKVNFLQGVIHN